MRILNLYGGLGGNRKLWKGKVTSVESDPKIATVYKRLYPQDDLVVGDAHEFLLRHYHQFDFIWSSTPCQRHTRMNKATRHKPKGYPDMRLYEEIIFLKHFFKGLWVVENVIPYYEPLIKPDVKMGRHIFWSNFKFTPIDVKRPPSFINKCNLDGKKAMMDWLGIHYDENIYHDGNHCPAQILRNCVHPIIGGHIMECAIQKKAIQPPGLQQPEFI